MVLCFHQTTTNTLSHRRMEDYSDWLDKQIERGKLKEGYKYKYIRDAERFLSFLDKDFNEPVIDKEVLKFCRICVNGKGYAESTTINMVQRVSWYIKFCPVSTRAYKTARDLMYDYYSQYYTPKR